LLRPRLDGAGPNEAVLGHRSIATSRVGRIIGKVILSRYSRLKYGIIVAYSGKRRLAVAATREKLWVVKRPKGII
jgi:hypothetical protein